MERLPSAEAIPYNTTAVANAVASAKALTRLAKLKTGLEPQQTRAVGAEASSNANIRKAVLAIVKKAEVRKRRSIVHVLRHTFGSLLIQQGESLAYVRDQMGHASIQVTVDIYGHLVPRGIVPEGRASTFALCATVDKP